MIFKIRVWFYYLRRDFQRFFLINKIIFYEKIKVDYQNYKDEITYLKNNGLVIFPYLFEKKYRTLDHKIYTLEGLPYVEYFGKKMFFQKFHSNNHIKYYFNSILAEQDLESPHRYCSEFFKVEEGDIILDLGVAEGNFSLYYVDLAKEIYLFESNTKWLDALQKTFEPYSEKVKIVNKRVSNLLSESSIAIDEIKGLSSQTLFVKIDVDGSENEVLSGMIDLLKNSKNIKVAICTYHNQNDAIEFENFFQSLNFQTEFTQGYMLFYHDKNLKYPYFRKGVLRAWKKA